MPSIVSLLRAVVVVAGALVLVLLLVDPDPGLRRSRVAPADTMTALEPRPSIDVRQAASGRHATLRR
ncbi:MAG: hypothetical protein AB7O57_02760 [Hyphomicrobiaceae bacterium]